MGWKNDQTRSGKLKTEDSKVNYTQRVSGEFVISRSRVVRHILDLSENVRNF